MNYGWKALPLPGVAALRDELGNNAGLVQRSGNFVVAYLAHENGPVRFEKLQGRYALLGVYPSLKKAGHMIEEEIRFFQTHGKYLRVLSE